jgi:hypothetical protein
MNSPEPILTPQLARRIAELRACDNISALEIVWLDVTRSRALVRLVPRVCDDVETEAEWLQPAEPFLMVVDVQALVSDDHALH